MSKNHVEANGCMWSGRAQIEPGWGVFTGTAGDHERHRHHAVQIAVGLDAPVAAWIQDSGDIVAPGVVIAADCLHQLASGPNPLLLIYLERESSLGRVIDDWCGRGAKPLSAEQAERVKLALADPTGLPFTALETAVESVLLVPANVARKFRDQRIDRAISSIPRPPPEGLSAEDLAKAVGMSGSRFSHLFRAHTGMPLRPYLRWLRLQQALAEVIKGSNLTESAHAAGFSDSAHLSRSFRNTFGISPNALLNPALKLKGSAT